MDDIVNFLEIYKYLEPKDLQKFIICSKYIYHHYNQNYIKYIIQQQLNINIIPSIKNLKILEYGFQFKKQNIEIFENQNFYFFIIHSEYKKKIKFQYWYDQYLRSFFNYSQLTNYFLYKENEINHNFIKDLLYFEVTILNHIHLLSCISIGYSIYSTFLECVDVTFLLGWLDYSIGLHSDDGYIYLNNNRKKFIQLFNKQDIIGCGYDFNKNIIFYTMNGKYITEIEFNSKTDLFPCIISDVCLNNFHINYGQEKFIFNLQNYIKE
jgi:hypothetical protein